MRTSRCYPGVRLAALLLAIVAAAPRARAQSVTGALQGRVLATGGEPLAGVVVSVGGPQLQGERAATTDDRGRFWFLALPAGRYRVLLRRIGYVPVRIEAVAVRLGETTWLEDRRLEPQPVQLGEIVVSGARPLVDPTSTAAVTAFDSSQFRALPTGREVWSLMALVPQVTPSAYGDGLNVAGATGLENGYFVDGIHATAPLTANGSINIPWNFVREVQVTTGGYEAEFGRSQGAVVNVLTNSGSNEFHGQAVGFYTSDALRATPRWGVGQAQVEQFSNYDVGLSIGGPIAKDRLWFSAAWNPLVEGSDASFPGIPAQRDTRVRHSYAAKLTWRASPSTDIIFTALGDPSSREGVQQGIPVASVSDPAAVQFHEHSGNRAMALQAQHQVAARVLLTGSVSRLVNDITTGPREGGTDDLASNPQYVDYIENVLSGGYSRATTDQTTRTAGAVSLTILAGPHTAKIGVAYEENAYRGEDMGAILSRTASPNDNGGLDTVYHQGYVDNHVNAHNRVPSLYVQDAWEITTRLRLNAGLRWDGQYIGGDVGTPRSFTAQLAPRVGLVLQPGATGDQKVFASFGRFYEQVPLKALYFWHGTISQGQVDYPHNPLVDSTGGTLAFAYDQAGEAADQNLRGQHYDEVTAGYERRLGAAYRIGIRGIYRSLRWAVDDGAADMNGPLIVGNPGRGALAVLPRATRDYAALELTFEHAGPGPLQYAVAYTLSRNRGNYSGLSATDYVSIGGTGAANALPNSNFQFDFPEVMVQATGLLPNDRTHQLKLRGSYEVTRGLSVGAAAWVMSGVPLSEYGGILGIWPVFLQPRGTSGRTPTTWNGDLRVAWDVPAGRSRVRPRLLLDVFNIGNQRRAELVDQQRYFDAEQTPNPNYQSVKQYQAPLSVRLGMMLGF